MLRKRIICLVLALVMTFGCILTATGVNFDLADTKANVELADTGSDIYGLTDDIQDGQILQCWCWSFNKIKELMPKIAAQGFSAIQTSPIQASKESTKESWSTFMNSSWVFYQPVSFKIETNSFNVLGTKTEFKAMCDEAHKYGVKVIVDTIFNHMANDMSENTIHPWIPSDIKDNSDCWHDVSKNIYNYENRYDTTHYCLTGLPDLNTSNSTVQWHCTSFLKECIEAGADGFRFDAAKHIETPSDASGTKSDFWPNVLNEATEYAQETRGITPYYYGEILGTPGGGLGIDAYTKYMSVTDTGANDIRQAVVDGNASRAASSGISCGASPSKVVQWTESHDTFKDNGTRFISDHNINKTWAIVGARNEVCGLYLARPKNIDTSMLGDADVTSWSNPEVKAVNKFKNYFAGQSEYMASSGSVAYIERGTSGVVLVNTGGTYYNNMSVPAHKIKSGTYKDAITGNTFTVSNGYISGDIGDTGIAVVYDVDSAGSLTKGSVTDICVAGTFNNWSTSSNVMVAKDANVATTNIFLEPGEYSFKINSGDMWFSNKGTIEGSTGSSGWTMNPGVSDKCTLIITTGGLYTFSFNTANQKLVVEQKETTDSDVYLKGTFNDWDSSAQMVYETGANIVSTIMELAEGTYSFKIHNRGIGSWYSNTGTIEDTTGSKGWTMRTTVDDSCTFVAAGGTYTFSFNLSTNKLVVTNIAPSTKPTETTAPTDPTKPIETTTTISEETSQFYIRGDFNNWESSTPMVIDENTNYPTAVLELEAGEYGFKIQDKVNSRWYGNDGTIEDHTQGKSWSMHQSEGDLTLVASGGTYTFIFSPEDRRLIVDYLAKGEDPEIPDITPDEHTVTFVDYDGTVIDIQTVADGGTAVPPADPVREGTKEYSFIFTGWDKSFIYVTEDIVVTATYQQKANEFKVTFINHDDTVVDVQYVPYGESATKPADPTREPDVEHSYTFAGWDKSFTEITEDITLKATYTESTREYVVNVNEGNFIFDGAATVLYGDSYTFKITVKEGNILKKVTYNGAVLIPDANDVYKIDKVSGFVNIKVVTTRILEGNDFAGVSLTLNGNIEVNFHMALDEEFAKDESAKIVFTLPSGNKKTKLVKDAEIKDSHYIFTCEVAAKEMATDIKAQLFATDYESEVIKYSVKEYADYVLSSSDAEYESSKDLVKAMLNYGAAAQTYFVYNTEKLANADLSDADKALSDVDLSKYRYSLSGNEAGVVYYGSKLSLKSETAIKHYFYIEDEENLPVFKVNGKTVAPKKNGAYYEIIISNILAQDLEEKVVVTVGDLTLDYNVFSFGHIANTGEKESLKTVIKALYAYHREAEKFVG